MAYYFSVFSRNGNYYAQFSLDERIRQKGILREIFKGANLVYRGEILEKEKIEELIRVVDLANSRDFLSRKELADLLDNL